MEFNFAEKVTVLGTDFVIKVVSRKGDDPDAKRHAGAYGFIDNMRKQITLFDRGENYDMKDAEEGTIINWMKKTLRHEIVHAFMFESGLNEQARMHGSWARNEEIIDWMAIQGPKIMKAWQEAGAL